MDSSCPASVKNPSVAPSTWERLGNFGLVFLVFLTLIRQEPDSRRS